MVRFPDITTLKTCARASYKISRLQNTYMVGEPMLSVFIAKLYPICEWALWTDEQIAKHIGASVSYLEKVRKSLKKTEDSPKPVQVRDKGNPASETPEKNSNIPQRRLCGF